MVLFKVLQYCLSPTSTHSHSNFATTSAQSIVLPWKQKVLPSLQASVFLSLGQGKGISNCLYIWNSISCLYIWNSISCLAVGRPKTVGAEQRDAARQYEKECIYLQLHYLQPTAWRITEKLKRKLSEEKKNIFALEERLFKFTVTQVFKTAKKVKKIIFTILIIAVK